MSTHSSYKLEIAENILQKFGVRADPELLKSELNDPNSFFRLPLRLPSHVLKNEIILQQVIDLLAYCQHRLTNVIFANYASAMKQGIAEADDSNSALMLEQLQQEFETESESLAQLKANFSESKYQIDAFIREKVQQIEALNDNQREATIKQAHDEMKQRLLKLTNDVELYHQHMATIDNIDRRISGYLQTYPDPLREAELKLAPVMEKPMIYRIMQAAPRADSA